MRLAGSTAEKGASAKARVGLGEGKATVRSRGGTGQPGQRAPSHADPAEQRKAGPSRSLALGEGRVCRAQQWQSAPSGPLHRPPPRKAGEQGSGAEAGREAGQAAGGNPGKETPSLAGAKLGLRDHARPSACFSTPGQAVLRVGHPLPPPSAPSRGASRGGWAAPLGKGSDVKRQEARWAGKEGKEERRGGGGHAESTGVGLALWARLLPGARTSSLSFSSITAVPGYKAKASPNLPLALLRAWRDWSPPHPQQHPCPEPPGAVAESKEEMPGRRNQESTICIPSCYQG